MFQSLIASLFYFVNFLFVAALKKNSISVWIYYTYIIGLNSFIQKNETTRRLVPLVTAVRFLWLHSYGYIL